MAWALSMGMIRSRESEFGRASSGPTSLRHRATGSKRTLQTRARPGKQTGCRTSHEFADRRFVLPHECPHLRIEIWDTLGQIWATRPTRPVALVAFFLCFNSLFEFIKVQARLT